MSSHWFQRVQVGIFACLIALGVTSPLACADEQPETFYYLAVPSCPGKGDCVFVACIQLNRQGIPVDAKGKAGTAPFFSIWRSGYWEEKAPDAFVKNADEWKSNLDADAERAVAKKASLANLPDPITKFFFDLERLRCASLGRQIILQPLFKTEGFVGWQHVKHLDVLATPTTVSDEERSRALLASFQEAVEKDPAKSLRNSLASVGVKPQSVRYWPEYNVFLIEADAKFIEVETLFSPLY